MMIKKNLFLLFVMYFFVVQLAVIGYLRNDLRFYYLATINLVVILLVTFLYILFSKQDKESEFSDNISHKYYEKKINTTTTPLLEEVVVTTESSETIAISAPSSKDEKIEHLKRKIIGIEQGKQRKNSFWYRVILFFLFVGGMVCFLYFFWFSYEFLSIMAGSLLAMVLIGIFYKWIKLWRKTIWANFSFLFFLLVFILGFGMFILDPFHPVKSKGETIVGSFVSALHEIQYSFFVGKTSNLDSKNFISNLGEYPPDITGDQLTSGDELQIQEPDSEELVLSGDAMSTTGVIDSGEALGKEVSYLEAIKYLIEKNAIPLSQNQKLSFLGMSKTSPDYAYMVTAAELKMIGNNANPKTITSCEVYMVFKGLVEKRDIQKTSDVKGDYRKAAVSRDALNGCSKGSMLLDSYL